MENRNRVLYQFEDNNGVPFYFGITNNFKRRKCEHLVVLKKGKNGKSWPVYNKIRKLMREESYELKMVIIKDGLSYDEANQLEIQYIKEYKEKGIKLYNLTAGGEGTLNHKPVFTEEWRKKLSEAKSGDKFTKENNSFYGKHHSKETKIKISLFHKGKFVGDKNPFYGKHHTDEVCKKLSEIAKKTFSGVKKTEDHKRKISESNKGKKLSKEHNEKNRLKSCVPYKVRILATGEEFNWLRGTPELSKHLMIKYNIKMTASSITQSVAKNRSCRHILATKLLPNFD